MREQEIENVKRFTRGTVSFYISDRVNAEIKRMADEMLVTKSEILDAMVGFASENFDDFKMLHDQIERKLKNEKDRERIEKLKDMAGLHSESAVINFAIRFCLFRIKSFLRFLPTVGDEK